MTPGEIATTIHLGTPRENDLCLDSPGEVDPHQVLLRKYMHWETPEGPDVLPVLRSIQEHKHFLLMLGGCRMAEVLPVL